MGAIKVSMLVGKSEAGISFAGRLHMLANQSLISIKITPLNKFGVIFPWAKCCLCWELIKLLQMNGLECYIRNDRSFFMVQQIL